MDDEDFAELFRKVPKSSSSGTSWQDVATEFEALGRSIGDVLRSAWQRQDEGAGLGWLRDSLHAIMHELNEAAAGSAEGRQARDQLTRLTEAIHAAAARAGDEVRPELLSLLREANAELRRLARLDERPE